MQPHVCFVFVGLLLAFGHTRLGTLPGTDDASFTSSVKKTEGKRGKATVFLTAAFAGITATSRVFEQIGSRLLRPIPAQDRRRAPTVGDPAARAAGTLPVTQQCGAALGNTRWPWAALAVRSSGPGERHDVA